ncbi:hypothetical protein PILCRDRAFT_361520 [Piloderma croceum F 1598]|uniref:Uncharacterized protein n=1 Tax=Piloderma croceum (strain F 1598) TaxID=765440 RepID=A0A0C3G042_PILCF|nr:hypothetical protein PILCRDRAFT_361520 [Piloderma croceum F 1598]
MSDIFRQHIILNGFDSDRNARAITATLVLSSSVFSETRVWRRIIGNQCEAYLVLSLQH